MRALASLSRADAPPGASWAVFERDVELPKPLSNLVRDVEVLVLAGIGTQVDEELHEAGHNVAVASAGGRRQKNAKNLAQLPESESSPLKRIDGAGRSGTLELLCIREAI